MTLFNSPVFIKQLGLIVPADAIYAISLQKKISRQYEMTLPSNSNEDILVESKAKLRVSATFMISRNFLQLMKSKDEINDEMLDQIDKFNEEQLSLKKNTVTEVRRGRKAKVADEEDEEEEIVAATLDDLSEVAYSIDIFEIEVPENNRTTFSDSAPYQKAYTKNEKWARAIEERTAKRKALVNAINKYREQLNAPTMDGISQNAQSLLIPSDDSDVAGIDRQGFNSYEKTLRDKISIYENQLRSIYDWYKEKIIDSYNTNTKVINKPLNEDIKIGSDITSIDSIIDSIGEEFKAITL